MTKERKYSIQLWASVVVLMSAQVLMFCAFWVSPVGEIHNSNIFVYGEALSFVGAIMGVDYRYKRKYEKEDEHKAE